MPAFAEGPLSGGACGNRARAGELESRESSSRGGRGLALRRDPRVGGPRAPHRARASFAVHAPADRRSPPCALAAGARSDRYYLLAVDKQWHLRCLKCCECKLALESELTCFAKDGSIFCKEDYYRYSQPAPFPAWRGRQPGASRSPPVSPAQGSPPRAPSNCSVPTPARPEEGAPGGGHPRSRARSRLSRSGGLRSTAGHVLGGSVNVSASTEAKRGWVCVFRLLRNELSQAGALELSRRLEQQQ